jgi:membrane associated rhomboid family serine protease
VNCSILILGLAGFQLLLGSHLIFLGFILLPAAFLFYILYQVTTKDQNLAVGLTEHVAFQFERFGPRERQREWFPRVTYSLVLLHLVLYYGLSIHLKPATLLNHFSFLPATPNFWNVPLSVVTAQVLHADGWQLWGSVVFLWIIGTTVEKSLGSIRFLGIYFLTGMAAGEFGALAHSLFLGSPLHGMGSSGAIAGLIGIFAVCCQFRSLAFPLPVLGAISLVYPISVIIRLDALAVIGTFFFCSLSGGLDPHPGLTAALVEHLVNIGGMAGGVLIGLLLDPEKLTAGEPALTG